MRRILALVAAALLLAACAEAFEPPPSGGGGATGPSTLPATETPEPPPTPVPSPAEMEIAGLPDEGEEELHVQVLGWLEVGSSTLCGGGTCIIRALDPRDPTARANLEIPTGADGAPNTMRSLGSGYAEADLLVTAGDGTELRSGDYAWLTGWWDPVRNTLATEEIAPGTAPRLKATTTPIARLARSKQGTVVRVTGALETPFVLSCFGGTCNLYLADASGESARVEVRLGARGEVRPNTMWPLEDNFRDADLRVFDAAGKTCRAGNRVSVIGWVRVTEDGTRYLDPVYSITRVES